MVNNNTGWWCNVPILKNDGVKVNGFRMTSLFDELENHPFMFETTNQTRWLGDIWDTPIAGNLHLEENDVI